MPDARGASRQVVERPQHMLMRVAIGIHLTDIDAAIETYNLMSERWFTHASPTMFNAGTPKPQMSSCFLLSMVGRRPSFPRHSLRRPRTHAGCPSARNPCARRSPTPPLPRARVQTGDSIEGIYGTLKRCALISKAAGGVGLSVSNIRGSGSYIRGTNGTSNGLIPMLRVFNNTARFVNQGGGKRQGSFAVYLE
eukprot:4274590-Prymnesium_polylepis.1